MLWPSAMLRPRVKISIYPHFGSLACSAAARHTAPRASSRWAASSTATYDGTLPPMSRHCRPVLDPGQGREAQLPGFGAVTVPGVSTVKASGIGDVKVPGVCTMKVSGVSK